MNFLFDSGESKNGDIKQEEKEQFTGEDNLFKFNSEFEMFGHP